jgi:hypothetical protein
MLFKSGPWRYGARGAQWPLRVKLRRILRAYAFCSAHECGRSSSRSLPLSMSRTIVGGPKPVLTPTRRTDQLQAMLRNLGVTFLLVALAGPASATDPSAVEETNCLMACDANQQNCHAIGQVSAERNYSFAQHSPPSKIKSAVVRSRQMIQLPEAREIARVSH